MFNLQAGVLEKSKSCFRVQKFTKAAPQTEKPCRFPIDESDSVYVFINKCRPTYLCQKQTLRSSTTYPATHTHRWTPKLEANRPVSLPPPRLSRVILGMLPSFWSEQQNMWDHWLVKCDVQFRRLQQKAWRNLVPTPNYMEHEKLIWWQQVTLKGDTNLSCYMASHLRTPWWKPNKQMFFLSGNSPSVHCEVRKSQRQKRTKMEDETWELQGWRTENWSVKKCKRTALCSEKVAYGLSEFCARVGRQTRSI